MSEPDVELRPLLPSDAPALLELHVRNRDAWRATAPLREDAWFALDVQRRRIEAEALDRVEGRGLFFGIFADGRLAGRISLAGKRVLEKAGFRREGLAERYLRLDGRWTDQELWAITVEDALR